MFIFVVLQMCIYTSIYLFLPAGRQEHVNVTCHYVIPTSPPSTTIETTSGVISSQATDLIVKSTPNIIEKNSNKTLELSTQVICTTNKGNPITTPVILDHTRGTSAVENSNLTVMTTSEPGGMQNTRQVSTTTSRRNLSTKTGNYLRCPIVHLKQNVADFFSFLLFPHYIQKTKYCESMPSSNNYNLPYGVMVALIVSCVKPMTINIRIFCVCAKHGSLRGGISIDWLFGARKGRFFSRGMLYQ
jgi:hypothetical protein